MTEEIKRIEFPLGFFERLKKKVMAADIIENALRYCGNNL